MSAAAGGGIQAILLDIEGTTTPIAFVADVLFPYVRRHVRAHVERHAARPDYRRLFDDLRAARAADDPGAEGAPAAIVAYVEWLMDRDRKSTPLKELQGRMWEEGYQGGELVGQVFADVAPALARWNARGLHVAIFSSGSVLAQQLLFRHSSAGDLTRFLGSYFDTRTGAKGEAESYRRIAESLAIPPEKVLFLSDVVRELDAARSAGMQTVLVSRPGNQPPGRHGHPVIHSFDELVVGEWGLIQH